MLSNVMSNSQYFLIQYIISMSQNQIQKSEQLILHHQFKEQPYRWVIFTLFIFVYTTQSLIVSKIAPIALQIQQIYQVSAFQINVIPLSLQLSYIFVNLPANYFIDDYGIKTGLLIGTTFFVLGSAIQIFINKTFATLLIGAILNTIGCPFVLNCSAKIATFWFRKEKRVTIINTFTLIHLMGTVIGLIIPTLFLNQNSSVEQKKIQIFHLMLFQLILIGSIYILLLIFFRNKPKSPVSLGAQIQKIRFIKSIRQLLKNTNYIKLFFANCFFLGPLTSITGLFNLIFTPFNFSDRRISIFGVQLIFAGIIGASLATYYINKSLKYTKAMKFTTFISVILFSGVVAILIFHPSFYILIIIIFLMGIFITPLYALGYDLSCEIAFPVGEAQASGIIAAATNISGITLILLSQTIIGFGTVEKSIKIMLMHLACIIIGTLFYWTIKNDLRRRNLEEKQQTFYKQQIKNKQSVNK